MERPPEQGAPIGSAGLYAPGDAMWQLNREAVLLLAGPRALLMQLAHPLVAAGVGSHSDFRRDPLGRLRRTLDAMLGIIFGDAPEARAHAERIHAVHARVRGRLGSATEAFPAGTPYDALDPDLLFWVQATLQDSARLAYEVFVDRLDDAERERVYQESKRMAPLFGLPLERLPRDEAAFRLELDDWIEGPRLEVTAEARALAAAVLEPPIPWLPRPLARLGSAVTLSLLPTPLRERYGLAYGPGAQRAARTIRTVVRATRPRLPEALRVMPQARRAERRHAAGRAAADAALGTAGDA